MKIVIVGAGAAGTTAAIHLASAGMRVVLTEIPGYEARIETLRAFGILRSHGLLECEALIEYTPVLSQVRKADILLVTTVADAHPRIAECLERSSMHPKAILFYPGNGGSLFLQKWLNAKFTSATKPIVIEANTIPYGCRVRLKEPNAVDVSVLTPCVLYSGSEPTDPDILRIVKTLTPKPVFGGTLASVFLSNPNPLFHTLPCLLNVGWIEKKDSDFRMYEHGVTPSVMRVLQVKDAERKRLLAAVTGVGMSWDDLTGDIRDEDGTIATLHFLECGRRAKFQGPHSLEHRYVTEDTATGLVCLEKLGVLHGVRTPIITSEIDLISVLLAKDFRKLGAVRAALIG